MTKFIEDKNMSPNSSKICNINNRSAATQWANLRRAGVHLYLAVSAPGAADTGRSPTGPSAAPSGGDNGEGPHLRAAYSCSAAAGPPPPNSSESRRACVAPPATGYISALQTYRAVLANASTRCRRVVTHKYRFRADTIEIHDTKTKLEPLQFDIRPINLNPRHSSLLSRKKCSTICFNRINKFHLIYFTRVYLIRYEIALWVLWHWYVLSQKITFNILQN